MTQIKAIRGFCAVLFIFETVQPFLITTQDTPATRCYKCDGVKNVFDCTRLETCRKSQVCYAYKTYSDADSEYRFYGGCVDRDQCCSTNFQHSIFNKDTILCAQCCEGDSCNNRLCGEKVTNTPCLNCNKIATISTCNDISYCKPTETCATFLYANNTVTYRCEDKMICQKTAQMHKRMSPDEQYQLCASCCTFDNCNAHPSCSLTAATSPHQYLKTPTTTACPLWSYGESSTTAATTAPTKKLSTISTIKPTTTATTTKTAATTPTASTAATTTTAAVAKTKATTVKHTQKPHHGSRGFRCEVCSGPLCGVIKQDVQKCPNNSPYCINTINYVGMALTVKKGCASATTCTTKWWEQTSDRGECTGFDPNSVYSTDFACHYCCRKDECNLITNPVSQGSKIMFHP